MGRTVAEMRATMGAAEYDAWIEYYRVEPWGALRDNLHAGIVASAVLAPYSQRKPAPGDFMLKPAGEQRRAETMGVLAALRARGVRRGS
jgi:hypothetical protein